MTYDLNQIEVQVGPHKSYQDYLDNDRNPPPEHFRDTGDTFTDLSDLEVSRYVSRDFYERERVMWDKVWQVACREEHIPNVGDVHVYEVCKRSYLIVRVSESQIKAYPNVCLHRGRKLRTESGNARDFKCPFHGFTWGLDGASTLIPCQWDFPHVKAEEFHLPDVQVGAWAGWVFINPDPTAMPLDAYLDPIKEQFAPYLWDQSYLGVHVGKVLKGNWKIIQEAFMESFHSLYTHPQIMAMIDDMGCQYDHWADKPHVNRMMVPFNVASPYVVDQMTEKSIFEGLTGSALPDGVTTARQAMADRARKVAEEATGADLSHVSDAELADGWYYNVFPNLMHWGGYGPNMWYRFRPHEDSHERTLMEVGYLMRHPKDAPKPAPAPYIQLGLDDSWSDVEALGGLGGVLDQDTTNMEEVHQGLEATFKPGVTLAASQESRIRHFHQTLDGYVGG